MCNKYLRLMQQEIKAHRPPLGLYQGGTEVPPLALFAMKIASCEDLVTVAARNLPHFSACLNLTMPIL